MSKESFSFGNNIEVNKEAKWKTCAIDVIYCDGVERSHNALVLEIDGQQLLLNWANTKLVFHYDPDKELEEKTLINLYDNIEIDVGGDKPPLCIQLKPELEGIVDYLMRNGYATESRPIPELSTYEWAIKMESKLGDIAIEAFLEDNQKE